MVVIECLHVLALKIPPRLAGIQPTESAVGSDFDSVRAHIARRVGAPPTKGRVKPMVWLPLVAAGTVAHAAQIQGDAAMSFGSPVRRRCSIVDRR
jgi:hypothetical protein